MTLVEQLIKELSLKRFQVENVIKMIDEGSTIPFIARYRKEQTGEMDDEQLRKFEERLTYIRNLDSRKEEVIRIITEQEKLTPELKKEIESAKNLQRVEDLYLPYKKKKRTRATIAKELGLEPLADIIWAQEKTTDLDREANKFIDIENKIDTIEDAINGASDILAEKISDTADYREALRKMTYNKGIIESKASKEDEESVYEMYYDYKEPVNKIVNHRILALNRGEKEKLLKVKIDLEEEIATNYLERQVIIESNNRIEEVIKNVIKDSYKRLIQPSIEREIRKMLTERAEESAIEIFAQNLKPLLLQAPVKDTVCLSCDPGFAHGCKLAVIDGTGKLLDNAVIYPVEPRKRLEQAEATVKGFIEKYDVKLIAIGNGTASRETEAFIANLLSKIDREIYYTIVSESGASVYSASKLASEEYPNLDVETRGAISIGRRLQDPLAELVKIDPKAIGVGQYQHDVNQKQLGQSLSVVVEDCVNHVGVDLNTASPSLLTYISGVNKTIAKNVVDYREENGKFKNRKELLKVPRLGKKAFEQCAGFLRISDGKNVLDNTSVHPESYVAAEKLLKILGYTEDELRSGKLQNIESKLMLKTQAKTMAEALESMAKELELGVPTLKDIVEEIKKPGRDPRDEMPKPVFRSDVLSLKDLKEGMVMKGTVRNVVDFGAFVDIGVHDDGLVHISQLANKYVKHPLDVVSVGDVVDVKIIELDIKKKRIALTMKDV